MRVMQNRIKGINVFTSFLSELNVKYTESFANRLFNEHPHKYDLYGISTMLTDYGINNKGIRIDNKLEDILNLTTPFIAHVGNEFVMVHKVSAEKVNYIWNGKNLTTTISEFVNSWSGIVLLAELTPKTIEPNFEKHKAEERFFSLQITMVIAASLFIVMAFMYHNEMYKKNGLITLFLINLIGAYIGYLLLLKQMNIQSVYADKICSLFKKSDCNNILESSAAKIYGFIGWSEVGFGYFISNIIIIVFFPSLISYVAIINLCSLPYSFWSIWYQKFKAKQWCPLCLIVQLILWMMFLVNFYWGNIQIPIFSVKDVLIIGSLFLLSILLTNIIVPKMIDSKKMGQIIQEMSSLKMNDRVFATLLKEQPYYHVEKKTSAILLGSPKAPILITILTNPHCNPCAKMHGRIKNILNRFGDQVCIQYIFSSFNKELDYSGKFLIAVFLQSKYENAMKILDEWYEYGKIMPNAFFNKYAFIDIDQRVENEYASHQQWKVQTHLMVTPTILVNGYKLPEYYRIEELKYFTKLFV